jgi:hypothetical protein
MAQSSPEEAKTQISHWYSRLGLTDTKMEIEVCEDGLSGAPPWWEFRFRPTQVEAFDLDIIVSGDGYWGMGILHPKHSLTVYAWGFEGTQASCKTVLQLASVIAAGNAEIVVSKFELAGTVGWLELPDEELKKLRDLTRYDRVRRSSQDRLLRKRILSRAWN